MFCSHRPLGFCALCLSARPVARCFYLSLFFALGLIPAAGTHRGQVPLVSFFIAFKAAARRGLEAAVSLTVSVGLTVGL